MKMDFRISALLLLCATALACGKQRTSSSTFNKASDECMQQVVPKRFVVRYFNGRHKVIEAESKAAFINGYLSENLEQIEYAEHDFYVRSFVSSKAKVVPQAGYASNWGPARMEVDRLWQAGVRGDGVVVAVVDSGMDINHVQLRDQIAINTGEIEGNKVDDDHNGYVDDVKGYNFARREPLTGDMQYHGTHVSGIIAAAHNDLQAQAEGYVQGVAPGAKILPLGFLDGEAGLISHGVEAIEYAVNRGVRIINASWGGEDCSKLLKDTIASLHERGVIFVGAAGNESLNIDRNPMFPAAHGLPSQITVGSVTSFDGMSHFSNYGMNLVHIFAPGSDIVSTYPGNRMASLSGTSMSAPMVAGIVALLWGAEPLASIEQIREAIFNTATHQNTYINATRGRVSVANTLSELRRLRSAPTP